jgi:hypothetical protein
VLHQRPNTFAQTCLLALSFSLQSDGGPYIYGHVIQFLDECVAKRTAMLSDGPCRTVASYMSLYQ